MLSDPVSPVSPVSTVSPVCPDPVRRAVMEMGWNLLTFIHWRYEPDVVQALLPEGLTVQTFDGSAWVGLVPFQMRVTIPRTGAVPWISNFEETNVRTYATAADGTSGVWFLSLDAARLAAVVTARTTYRLPYFWSKMSLSKVGPVMTYDCRRRWPGPRHATSRVAVAIGERFADDELGGLDHWLTARWRLYSDRSTGVRFAKAEHPPWELHRADLLHCDDQLVVAAGLPAPTGVPLVHWSPGTDVRVGLPHRVP